MTRTYSRSNGEVSTTPSTGNGQRHMSRQKKGIRLTTKRTEDISTHASCEQKKENSQRAEEWLNSKAAAGGMAPKQEEEKMNKIFCVTMQIYMKDGTTYMDCTGKFPV